MFELGAREKDGRTVREHLETAQRQLGRPIPELEVPPLPEACADWWSLWGEVSGGRPQAFVGVAPLGWADLAAWMDLTGRRDVLTPLDVAAIRAIDSLFVELRSEDAKKQLPKVQKHGH